MPDRKYGAEVAAVIRLRKDASTAPDEIIGFCCGQTSHYKLPRYVRFVSAFPLTVHGHSPEAGGRKCVRSVVKRG